METTVQARISGMVVSDKIGHPCLKHIIPNDIVWAEIGFPVAIETWAPVGSRVRDSVERTVRMWPR